MSNDPKREIGQSKPGLAYLPMVGIWCAGEVMRQGGLKYGAYNFRETEVSLSVYYDAIHRHLTKWWEGQECDEESNMPHLAHIIANCALVLDGQWREAIDDDRPVDPVDMEDFLGMLAYNRP